MRAQSVRIYKLSLFNRDLIICEDLAKRYRRRVASLVAWSEQHESIILVFHPWKWSNGNVCHVSERATRAC